MLVEHVLQGSACTKIFSQVLIFLVLRNNEYFYFYVFLTTVDTIGHNRRFAYLIELLNDDTEINELFAKLLKGY
jgi:hypothetical protein